MPWGLFPLLKNHFQNYKINLTHKKQFWRVNSNGFDPFLGYVGKGPNPFKSNKNEHTSSPPILSLRHLGKYF